MPTRPTLFRPRHAVLAAVLALAMPAAMAWTSKPVRMLVPAPAGGTMDVIARLLADQLSADLGTPVVVDNKPGAGGGIAISAMLAAPPDGQTIMVKYKDGEKKVIVPPNTPIYAPGNKSELKPGAHLFIFAATRQADGSLTTTSISVGRDGVVPPM